MDERADVVVIGGGVIGTAITYAASALGRSVLLVEAAARLASSTTSRNSGVIHSGLYYRRGSLKARACVRGNALTYAWCERYGIPHARMGKLVVAKTGAELGALESLFENARACGATGVSLIDGAALARIEPEVTGIAALHCANTGIVDAVALATSFAHAAIERGAHIVKSARVTGLRVENAEIVVDTDGGSVAAACVINAAGFSAPDIARMVGVDRFAHRAVRGDYFRITSRRRFRTLIYPVRVPGDPGLGVHLTLGLDGSARLGPDARVVADDRVLGPADELRDAFVAAGRRLLGEPLGVEDLAWDGCGIRPKLVHDGAGDADFVIHEEPRGVIHLIGIESPGLTAALALAEECVARFSRD